MGTRFQNAILTFIARQTREHEVDNLRQAFESLDQNGEGMLTKDKFRHTFTESGLTKSDKEIDEIFDSLDVRGVGRVRYTEWVAATLKPDIICSERALKGAFEFFDQDGSGTI